MKGHQRQLFVAAIDPEQRKKKRKLKKINKFWGDAIDPTYVIEKKNPKN
jgi:hypothetical protein